MKKEYLLTPGPTPVPPQAREVMARSIIHHRTPAYRKVFQEVSGLLQTVFKTRNNILTFTSSGTGAMEASVVNLLSKGDKAVVVRGGKFGERFTEICRAYNVEAVNIDVEWGTAVNPELVSKALEADKEISAVFTTLCETSTGVVNDIKAIGKIVKQHKAVLVVDAISGLCADNLETDKWEVDVVVAASQKGLMTPPGLAFVSISPKAWKKAEKAGLPKYYFDFKKAEKGLQKFDSPFTPAISLMLALRQALELIKIEGVDKVLSRHQRLSRATRTAVKSLGLKLLAPESPANTVTAVRVPEEIDGSKLIKLIREKYGVTIAGGQAALKGKIIRIAHLGYINGFDLINGMMALEMALGELGYRFKLGSGLIAAEEILSEPERTG
ncbi:MAG: alanine--glyoxylate aminotransferase family protein [Candidatus Omnitrophota bacterium]|nr:alanine--glyoxylate aminotransferase family protein [Candidatus Omnitrophota bacterium]